MLNRVSKVHDDVQTRVHELKVYLETLEGIDYRLDLQIKTKRGRSPDWNSFQESSDWNRSWC